jgi:hypothetical protein
MFPHPEDLYRHVQQQHTELIRNRALERQARAIHPPTHRVREIALHVRGLVFSRRWWNGISALFNRRSHPAGTPTTGLDNGALPIATSPASPL